MEKQIFSADKDNTEICFRERLVSSLPQGVSAEVSNVEEMGGKSELFVANQGHCNLKIRETSIQV